jgi:hypothetical protein
MSVGRVSIAQLQDLGIPCTVWAACLCDSRRLIYLEWRTLWCPNRPAFMSAKVYATVTRAVYESGPLEHFLLMSRN